jgi:AhpD family alkylhydroperoxidase
MAARLRYPEVAPEGYAALQAFGHYVNTGTALEPVLLGMVYLRASVVNGCEFCTELHKAELRKHHEPAGRIEAVAGAVNSDVFTAREQAALRWTDVITKLSGGPAPDEEYEAVSRFFQGKDLVDLTFAVANINAWNRMGVAFRPEWRPRSTSNGAGPARASQVLTASPSGDGSAGTKPSGGGTNVEDDGGKVGNDE